MAGASTVSVIIPVYNGERFVAEAIRCALEQTLTPLEVIVVDDASTDRTGQLIRDEFARQIESGRVRYVRNDRNRERSFSRNEGVRLAHGAIVSFLDYDDLWSPDYLATVTDAMDQRGYDLLYSFPRTFIDAAGEVTRITRKQISADPDALIFSSSVGYPAATVCRTACFQGYHEGCILREDWELFLRSRFKGLKIGVLDRNQVMIRGHGARSSAHSRFMAATLIVFHQYRNDIPEQYAAAFLFHVADVCLKFGDLPGGWRLFLSALGANPAYCLRPRNLFAVLKRGLRIDKYLRFRRERAAVAGYSGTDLKGVAG